MYVRMYVRMYECINVCMVEMKFTSISETMFLCRNSLKIFTSLSVVFLFHIINYGENDDDGNDGDGDSDSDGDDDDYDDDNDNNSDERY